MADRATYSETEPQDETQEVEATGETDLEAGAGEQIAESDETPEAESDDEGEAGEGESPEDEQAEPDDQVAALRAELDALRPLADLGRRFAESQRQAAAPKSPEPDERIETLIDQALTVLATEPDDAKRDSGFKAFPMEVQIEAAKRARAAEEDNLLRVKNPQKWAEKWVGPIVEKMLSPIAQKFAVREFEDKYSDIANNPEAASELANLLRNRVPLDIAAEVVRLRRNGPAAKTDDGEAETARAVREARRSRAVRKPERASAKKKPDIQGFYLEDVIKSLGQGDEE